MVTLEGVLAMLDDVLDTEVAVDPVVVVEQIPHLTGHVIIEETTRLLKM